LKRFIKGRAKRLKAVANKSDGVSLKIAVLGAGAWGTALACTFATAHRVCLWGRDLGHMASLAATGTNERYLPGVFLPTSLACTADLGEALEGADLYLVVTPFKALEPTLESLCAKRPPSALLWACKGIEADTGRFAHEIVEGFLGAEGPFGLLSGPSFADELAREQPTAALIAARHPDFARHWADTLHQPRFRLYASTDLVGAELGGAVKNVIAIAAGISDGLGFGLNARAALITRGLAEMARLGECLGAQRETLMGLSGMGDLILTCTGDLSRNRRFGIALATGQRTADILKGLGHVAEGVGTARALCRLAQRFGIEMPVAQAVLALIDDRITPRQAVDALLERDPRPEWE
jgi:glycerol-3-phosphate dehydrogenase (NAD(P)+)